MTTMMRWQCPKCGCGKLAPSRPRRDDARRYCLPCTDKTGRLVERIAPKLQAKREKAEIRSAKRAARRRAEKRDNQIQADLNTHFACGLHAFRAMLLALDEAAAPLIEVRAVKRPRHAVIEPNRITLYDADADRYEARAITVMAELRWRALYVHKFTTPARIRAYIRARLKSALGVCPRGLAHAETEITNHLRAKDAVAKLGHDIVLTRKSA